MKIKQIHMIDADEAEKSDVVACARVEALPIPIAPAHQEHCSECNVRIWVSETSPKAPRRICMECAAKDIEKRQESGEEITFATRNAPINRRILGLMEE